MPEIALAARTINERLMVEVAEYLADQVKPWYRTKSLKVTVMGLHSRASRKPTTCAAPPPSRCWRNCAGCCRKRGCADMIRSFQPRI